MSELKRMLDTLELKIEAGRKFKPTQSNNRSMYGHPKR